MKRSKRLEQIAEAAGKAKLLADVGCDHGYTALCALEKGQAEQALCMDINPGPLSIAVANGKKAGFSDRMQFLLSDGLRAAALPEEKLFAGEREKRDAFFRNAGAGGPSGISPSVPNPDAIVLSGMGGQLITDILSLLPTNGAVCAEETKQELRLAAREYLSGVDRLILSPQSEPERVRAFLWEQLDFHITEEKMLFDEGKYYLILTASPGREERYDPGDQQRMTRLRYGFYLFEKRDEVFRCYLEAGQRKINEILQAVSDRGSRAGSRDERRTELERELEEMDRFLEHWEEKA